MPVTPDMLYGHTDTIILRCLLDGESYGYEINRVIAEKSHQRFELKEATLYTAFRRLEESGCITSYWGDENTGARRRYYSITKTGREALDRRRREWTDVKALADKLMGIPVGGPISAGEKEEDHE